MHHATNRAPVSLLPLTILIFYSVCGGPFGIEAAVRAGGPLAAIMGFLLFPLVWSIPEALVTAELAAALPHASGGVAWVEEAFGKRIGALSGYLSWISGVTVRTWNTTSRTFPRRKRTHIDSSCWKGQCRIPYTLSTIYLSRLLP